MSKKKLYRILIEGIVCAVLIFILVFFVGFRVTKVEEMCIRDSPYGMEELEDDIRR